VPHTNSPYHRPALGTKIASTANHDGVAARFADPAVQQSLAGERALITYDAELLGAVARTFVNTAQHPDANTRDLLHTVPGLGTLLRLVLLYAMQASTRCSRGQDFVSSGRLVPWAQASAGKRVGTSGAKLGQAHRQWALSAAAVWCLRDHPAAQQSLTRWENKPATGNAWTVLAQQWARAVSHMRKRPGACERATFVQREGRGAGEPGASLDH
jgi:hypothetical protein